MLLESRSSDVSSIPWRVHRTFVSWVNSCVGTQSCPTLPGRPAGRPDPTCSWYVRVLDSTGLKIDLQISCLKHSSRVSIGWFFTHALTEAGPKAICNLRSDEFCAAPPAPLVALAVALSSLIRLSEILVSRLLALMSQVASLFRRVDAPMTIEVRSYHRSIRSVLDNEITASGGNALVCGVPADLTGMSGTVAVSTRAVWFSILAGEAKCVLWISCQGWN